MERYVKNDYEVIVELAGRAMAAMISIDPNQEWSMGEIAEMAVDQALAVHNELKRRKDERKKANGSDGTIEARPAIAVPRSGAGSDHKGIRGRLEK